VGYILLFRRKVNLGIINEIDVVAQYKQLDLDVARVREKSKITGLGWRSQGNSGVLLPWPAFWYVYQLGLSDRWESIY